MALRKSATMALALGVVALAVGAGAAAPTPAAAANVELAVSVAVVADGAEPWSDTDQASDNDRVRRGDAVSYRVQITPSGGTAHDVELRLAAKPQWAADAIAITCPTESSDAASCALGDVAEPVTVPAKLAVPDSAGVGDQVEVTASVQAAETAEPVVSAPVSTAVVADGKATTSPSLSPSSSPTRSSKPAPSDSSPGGSSGGSGGGTTQRQPGGGDGGSGSGGGSGGSGSGGGSGGGSSGGASSADAPPVGSRLTATSPGSAGLPPMSPPSTVPSPRVAVPPEQTGTAGPAERVNLSTGAAVPAFRPAPFIAAAAFVLTLAVTRFLLRRRGHRRPTS